jgi:uncharacterized protein
MFSVGYKFRAKWFTHRRVATLFLRCMTRSNYTIRWNNHLAEIPQVAWDALAVPLKTPFLEWEWLNNMETSGSVAPETGWLPTHLTVWQGQDLVGAAPLYVKGHSYGEFVFDNQWAELAQRMGIKYYPKLVGMSPVTPAEGYRFTIAQGADEAAITELMVRAIDEFCLSHKLSGCHFLYVDPEWRSQMIEYGYSTWINHNYVWQNQEYQTFDDYLGGFNANQRRNIKRERKAVKDVGLTLTMVTGDRITPQLLTQVYAFYADTCDKFGYWGSKYLTPDFFEQLHASYRHRLAIVTAHDSSLVDPVGMSFCITKGDRLYGRYWGSSEEIENLHFDACYYTPIEWGIQNGIKVFDPGAGGRHKKRRGFPATANYSLHRFYQPRFGSILREHFVEVNELEQQQIVAINQDLPMKPRPESMPLNL